MAATRYSIGYALLPKKQRSFLQGSLIELCSSHGIDLFRIDLERPLADQGPFDCILHKFHGDDWRRQLDDFIAKNRNAVILDAPDAIQRLHNRISMLQVISELEVDSETESFGIPNQIVIYDKETLLEKQPWVVLKFPVIAKPLVADGSAKSHKMSLVFNHDGLNKIKPPIVLQEFVNHGGVIFKVYVVGSHVKCVKRKSLPDIAEDELGSMESLSFSQVSNLSSKEKINNFYRLMQLDDTQMPPQGFISEIARELRKALKLNLFNFDVIRDSRNENRYLIIDINYFPGYAKMPGYEKVVTDFFCDIANNRESGEAQCSVEDDGAQPSSSQSKPMN